MKNVSVVISLQYFKDMLLLPDVCLSLQSMRRSFPTQFSEHVKNFISSGGAVVFF